MKKLKFWFAVVLIITSIINLILGIVLVVESDKKEWRNLIFGATLVSVNAGFALGTACLGLVWILWLVFVTSMILSIYISVLISYYAERRFPEHEERLWSHHINHDEIRGIETKHKCCGRSGPDGYLDNQWQKLPYSCFIPNTNEEKYWETGCFYLMEEESKAATAFLVNIMIAIAIFGFIQAISAQLLAILSEKKKRKTKRKQKYWKAAQKQYAERLPPPRLLFAKPESDKPIRVIPKTEPKLETIDETEKPQPKVEEPKVLPLPRITPSVFDKASQADISSSLSTDESFQRYKSTTDLINKELDAETKAKAKPKGYAPSTSELSLTKEDSKSKQNQDDEQDKGKD